MHESAHKHIEGATGIRSDRRTKGRLKKHDHHQSHTPSSFLFPTTPQQPRSPSLPPQVTQAASSSPTLPPSSTPTHTPTLSDFNTLTTSRSGHSCACRNGTGADSSGTSGWPGSHHGSASSAAYRPWTCCTPTSSSWEPGWPSKLPVGCTCAGAAQKKPQHRHVRE